MLRKARLYFTLSERINCILQSRNVTLKISPLPSTVSCQRDIIIRLVGYPLVSELGCRSVGWCTVGAQRKKTQFPPYCCKEPNWYPHSTRSKRSPAVPPSPFTEPRLEALIHLISTPTPCSTDKLFTNLYPITLSGRCSVAHRNRRPWA